MNFGENKVLLELVDNYHANPDNFGFFVGAGLSQPLFPTWGKLLKTFVAKAASGSLPYGETELNAYIDKGEQFLEVADACVQALGPTAYRDIMESEFDKDFTDAEIPEAYQELFRLAPKTIFTTNYDRIPDKLSKGTYRSFLNNSAPEALRAFSKGQSLVVKVHGDISVNTSIVLTTSDYQQIIHKNSATQNLLSSCLSTKPFIFIGFSLSDPHLNLILERLYVANNGIPVSHYVLLNESSQFKIDAFSKKFGLKIVPYTPGTPAHPEVSQFLRMLQHAVETRILDVDGTDKIEIDNDEALFAHLHKRLGEVFVDSSSSVFISGDILFVSFTAMGQTSGEIQRELLSAIKIFSFKYSQVKSIIFNVYIENNESFEFNQIQPVICNAEIDTETAYDYATKVISSSVAWKGIKFFTAPELTNPFGTKTEIRFPLSTGLLND